MTIRTIVTDIEGTTSSIRFVSEVLFPYSRARLAGFVREHAAELGEVVAAVRAEAGDDGLGLEGVIALLERWHDEDRKIGPLKQVQGLIWAQGYGDGVLKGHVYPDAVAALRRWHAAGLRLYVYSSGSVAAQKLLFGQSEAGDLGALFSGHFDTGVGSKREAASYRTIAEVLDLPAGEILFLSDVGAELDAARAAGFAVCLVARDGAAPEGGFPVVSTFEAIRLEDWA